MISLDQVILLEEKVESAVQKIQQLQEENAALRTKCDELTNALSLKSEQLSNLTSDQSQIENGIKNALERLDFIENSVLKSTVTPAVHITSNVTESISKPNFADMQDINHSDKETLSQNESTSEEENSLSEESALTEENKIIEENTLTEENSFTEENQQLEENADIDIPLPQENLRNGEEEVKKQNSSIITYNELENQENEESDVYDEELDSDSTMYSDSTPDDQDGLGFDIF